MKKQIKKLLGKNISKIRPFYHGLRSILGDLYYKRPSQKLTLIGITGTKGKTSTTILTGRILNYLGLKTGYLSTGAICLDGRIENEFINPHKNTTLDSFILHKFLSVIKEKGCSFVILEMSSIGLEQYRHLGLKKFDTVSVLNMFPEHIEHHGSWQKYKEAKGILLKKLRRNGNLVCTDDKNQQEIKNFFTKLGKQREAKISLLKEGVDYEIFDKNENSKLSFNWENQVFDTNLPARFQIKNLIFALEMAKFYVSLEKIKNQLPFILENLEEIPGRMEYVIKTNKIVYPKSSHLNKEFKIFNHLSIFVDYAHEPESLKQLLETLSSLKNHGEYTHLIHILSCDGAGRDDWKKPIMGKISSQYADFTILTTDNYDENDDPEQILQMLKKDVSKEVFRNQFKSEINRKESFKKAIKLAIEIKSNKFNMQNELLPAKVLIVSTGVGSEQQLTQPKNPIKWDERRIWTEVFTELG